MTSNLLNDKWINLDSHELRLLLDARIGHPGQYDGHNPDKLYLPLADTSCKIVLNFRDKKIVSIEPGPAFDSAEWKQIYEEVETSILVGRIKVGREYSFSSYRVVGSWRGDRSGVQILAPPDHAPRAPVERAEHPFILEFPMTESNYLPITSYRRLREHRDLTLLLNILLRARINIQPRRFDHFWAITNSDLSALEVKWVQQSYFATLGESVIDELSPPSKEKIEEIELEKYYAKLGYQGNSLNVPADLDQSICLYRSLSPSDREKFDRATFWMDMATRQWNISMSASYAALVSAIESLITTQGRGVTKRFKLFLENYAPGATLSDRRDEMYNLRSGILHGSELMQIDQNLAFGWDPPWWDQRELHDELWTLTKIALRNWLKNPTII